MCRIKHKLFKGILVLIAVFNPIFLFSQITVNSEYDVIFGNYPETGITPLGRPDYLPEIYIDSCYHGFYFQRINNFFQMNFAGNNMYVAGTGNNVVLYNTQTRTFNSIYCRANYTSFPTTNAALYRTGHLLSTSRAGLDVVDSLNPVSYFWKKNNSGESPSSSRQYGFLAQEVNNVLPSTVTTDSLEEMTLNYTAMLPVITSSLQELQSKISVQQQKLENLGVTSGRKSILEVKSPTNAERISMSYNLKKDADNVCLILSTMDDRVICKLPVTHQGDSGTASIDTGNLDPGIYRCSIIADNYAAGTVNVVITK